MTVSLGPSGPCVGGVPETGMHDPSLASALVSLQYSPSGDNAPATVVVDDLEPADFSEAEEISWSAAPFRY
jgi:hypothetical protein